MVLLAERKKGHQVLDQSRGVRCYVERLEAMKQAKKGGAKKGKRSKGVQRRRRGIEKDYGKGSTQRVAWLLIYFLKELNKSNSGYRNAQAHAQDEVQGQD